MPLRDYLFVTLGRHVKSHAADNLLDLCFFSQTRDAWRAWKQPSLESPRS